MEHSSSSSSSSAAFKDPLRFPSGSVATSNKQEPGQSTHRTRVVPITSRHAAPCELFTPPTRGPFFQRGGGPRRAPGPGREPRSGTQSEREVSRGAVLRLPRDAACQSTISLTGSRARCRAEARACSTGERHRPRSPLGSSEGLVMVGRRRDAEGGVYGPLTSLQTLLEKGLTCASQKL